MVLGCVGCVGNLACIVVFASKRSGSCFHRLMASLAAADTLYITMAVLLFGLPVLYPEYVIHQT